MKTTAMMRIFVSMLFSLSGLTAVTPLQATEDIWSDLAKGGKVILMRHAPVDKGKGKSLLRDPSCAEERNLSEAGRHAARQLAEQFKTRNIPIEEVRHSPFCRTTDTAKLVFARGTAVTYLSLLEILDTQESAAQSLRLNQIIGSYHGKGNLVLISHEPNIRAVSFELVKHLDFLVLQPLGGDEFEELAMVRFANIKSNR